MQKVTGIGGVFIYAHDPINLVAWYRKHLGIAIPHQYGRTYYHEFAYRLKENPDRISGTTWAIFEGKDLPNPKGRTFMVNYHVPDLNRLLAQLKDQGVEIEKVETYDYGQFAWIKDPEGNPIELFEENPHFKWEEQ